MIFYNEKSPFQAVKTKSLKSRKIDIFPKGLTHGFGRKMAIFPICFFQAIQTRKMSFMIFQNKKNAFLGYKNRKSKESKNCHFSKGFPWFPKAFHGFGPKMAIFSRFFFYAIRATKIFFMIFQNEKKPFQAIKIRSSKSQKN